MARTSPDSLSELMRFGLNPGNLKGWLFLPSILAPNASLAVVLHGCTQNAAGYDAGSGWSALAEKKGFAVLFPEQQRSNNANLCFNWFEPGDIRRGGGEARSIAEMVEHVIQAHGFDADRVFVTGLSAGGAMANVMPATYPELFAGGAIIGGLPYGVASGVAQAFERMQGRNAPTSRQLRSALSEARRSGPLPKVSIWHGTHDQTVRPINAQQIADQWRGAHRTLEAVSSQNLVNDHYRTAWTDADGREVVELYLVKDMGHGVPLAMGAANPLGKPGPFMLDAGISSTARIAEGWGLVDGADVEAAEAVLETPGEPRSQTLNVDAIVEKAMSYVMRPGKSSGNSDRPREGVGKVITDALRAAGLMR